MQWLPLSRHSAQTSPGTTRFFLSIHPLHLPYMIPCSYRASACKAVLPSCMAFYVISVRQTGDLPVVSLFPHPASFRFHLAMDTLTFGYILPTTGRIRDLHPLETCAAGRTLKQYTPARYRRGHMNVSLFAFRQMACHEMIRFDLAEHRFLASAAVCRIRTAGSKTATWLRVDRGSDLTL